MLRFLLRLSLIWAVGEALFSLRLGEESTLYWELDYAAEEFIAEIHTKKFNPTHGWAAIGFSNRGNISDGTGDFCVVWKSQLRAGDGLELTDTYVTNGTDKLAIDGQQDCKNFQFVIHNSTLKWSFRRKFVTCDLHQDYALEEGTTHLHWVKGEGPLWDIKGVSLSSAPSGSKRIRFLKNKNPPPPIDPKEAWNFFVLNQKVKIDPVETTYWCQVAKLPEAITKRKHHVVQFGPKIQEGNEDLVHHMEVFHCLTDANVVMPLYAGPCDAGPPEIKVCSRVIGAWAMGAEPLTYPKVAGFPIGGVDFNPYVRLEMHYNNPGLKSDYIDSSGMEFWVTDKLRKYEAGIIELGLEYTDKMAIPPGQEHFQLTGVCNRECTSVGLPPKGITIFASQLHTHLTGARVVTRHFRDSPSESEGLVELPFLNWDNHYSTHYQEIRQLKLPRQVFPGDVLLTTCEFQTLDRKAVTLGGFSISDEMCVNYVHYYPRSALEVCKSSVSWTSLREYFHFMAEMEGQKINPEGAVSSAYRGIEWTPFRAKLLSDFYNRSPIDMQCNQSNGARFPGSWDAMPVPPFTQLQSSTDPNEDCILDQENVSRDESLVARLLKEEPKTENVISTRDRLEEELLGRMNG